MARRSLSADDKAVWADVAKTVNRHVKTDFQPEHKDEPVPVRAKRPVRRGDRPALPAAPSKPAPQPLTHGHTAGMDGRTARRMKRGKLAIDDRIDLHGHTQRAAHTTLNRFIENAFLSGDRTVLVITGKGDPTSGRPGVLKEMVPRWLNEYHLRQWVSGFSYAAVKDGGEGALYIRIKRKR